MDSHSATPVKAASPPHDELRRGERPISPGDDPFYRAPVGYEHAEPGTVLRSRDVEIGCLGLISQPVKATQLLLHPRSAPMTLRWLRDRFADRRVNEHKTHSVADNVQSVDVLGHGRVGRHYGEGRPRALGRTPTAVDHGCPVTPHVGQSAAYQDAEDAR